MDQYLRKMFSFLLLDEIQTKCIESITMDVRQLLDNIFLNERISDFFILYVFLYWKKNIINFVIPN